LKLGRELRSVRHGPNSEYQMVWVTSRFFKMGSE
jgi:hypothetical protein